MNVKCIKCWWSGHDLNNKYIGWICRRCNKSLEYDDMVNGCIIQKINRWIFHKKQWFKSCPDCGKRFNRHDKNFNHIPF